MGEPAKTFEDLLVWQKAHLFVLAVYRLSGTFPKYEIYGLSLQFRRAAVSIAANIAEGFRKRSKADKIRFLNIAQGSVEECADITLFLRKILDMVILQKQNFCYKKLVKCWKHVLGAF
jgi:four helix bundle protein